MLKSVLKLELCFFFVLSSCQTMQSDGGYDEYPLVLATADLFNQKQVPKAETSGKTLNWSGDWVFRRQRLTLVDRELAAIKPDVIFFQQALQRRENKFENDLEILSAGALQGYAFNFIKSRLFDDTDEREGLGFAANKPFLFRLEMKNESGQDIQHQWQLGEEVFVGLAVAEALQKEDVPLLMFNVQTPEKQVKSEALFGMLKSLVQESIQRMQGCSARIVIGGRLDFSRDDRIARNFLDDLQLKDTAEGFCQNAARCVTATSQNELFLATYGEVIPRHVDKILVPRSAFVYSSSRILQEGEEKLFFESSLGQIFKKIWPSIRAGWTSTVRFQKCNPRQVKL